MVSAKSDVAESVYVRDLEMSPSKFVIARLLGRNSSGVGRLDQSARADRGEHARLTGHVGPDREGMDMRRLAISSLALALAVSGGCASPNQARLDPDITTVWPAPSWYASLPTTVAGTPAPAATSPGNTTVVQAPLTTSTVPAPDPALVPVPAGTPVAAPPGTEVVPAPGPPTVVPPAGTTTVVPAPATGLAAVVQTLRADDIKSPRVRAQTIYANRIEANEIRGVIHQDTGLKVRNTNGAITGSEIVASVIYADTIKADIVIADHIYVRDVRRR